MDPERWSRIDAALERVLDGEAPDLSTLTREEQRLLDRLRQSAEKDLPGLDVPPAEHEALASGLARELAERDGIEAGAPFGPFRIVEPIGQGGMGVVYLARRRHGDSEQRVALKVLAPDRLDAGSLRLFERERALLARLEHPGIARLIDGGVTEGQRPWLAMEFVDGEPLLRSVRRQRLGVRKRVELFLQACEALDHAHRRLVLHRDIKPANVLVDRAGKVRLVDFGLGRELAPDEPAGGAETTLAAGRMTPRYASPEQARGEAISVASEVYQLGLLLYQLLTETLPYEVRGHSAFEIARTISDAEIQRPSARWWNGQADDRAEGFDSAPKILRRRLRGDLDNIVLKALAAAPDARYSSAEALADDLRRHLASEPVRARAATRRYRFGRFVQRNAAAVTGGTAFVVLLVVSVTLLGLQASELQRQRDAALQSAQRSERLVDAMAGMIRLSDAGNPVEQLYSLGDLLDRYVDHVRAELPDDRQVRARLFGILGRALHGLDRWSSARAVLGDAVALNDAIAGPWAADSIELRMMLAEATAFAGDLAPAVELLDRLIDAAGAADAPPGHPRLPDLVYLRGFLRTYHAPRDTEIFRDGLTDLHRALSLYRDRHSEPHPDIAKAMHTIGFKTHDEPAGMQLMQRGLDMTRALFGEQHATTATRLAELALAHDLNGDPSRAAELAEIAYRTHAELQGDTHPDSLSMLGNLAGFHREAGALDRAATLYRELHELRRRTLPEDHLLLAFTAHGLGNTLRASGDHEQAERWLREALRLCRLHGSRNEAVTLENIARTLSAAGRQEDAIDEQRQAVEAYVRHFGEDAAPTRAAMERLSVLANQDP